jgi:glutathione S-transferase
MAKYLLVSFKTCPWVQRAAIVLREKNTAFEFRHIEPDNRPGWFLAISPHKKVPVLRIDEKVSLFESNAIAEYLDETIARGCIPTTRFCARSTAPGPTMCRPSPVQ